MGLFNTRTLQTIYNTAAGLTLLPPNLGGPSLLRDWTTYQTLDHLVGPAIEFSRGSTATFTGSNGLIQSSATNAPRFDYDPITLACKGLLIEEARTNLLLQSQALATTWGTAGSPTRTNNAATAPDGTTTATLFERTTTAASYIAQTISKATSAITYTFSTYAKANTGRYFAFQFTCTNGTGGTGEARFDLQNGSISSSLGTGAGVGTTTATITNAGNGWYRCSVTTTSDNGTAIVNYLSFSSVSNASVLTVDSSATSSGYLWGAQLEAGAFPTSYIPTTTATVTRSADVAQITGSNFTSLWNASAGSAYSQFISRGFLLSGVSRYNGRAIGYDSGAALLGSGGGTVNKNQLSTYNLFGTPAALSTLITGSDFTASPVKGAMSYGSSGRSLVGNGQAVVTDAGTVGTITKFVFGNDATSGNPINGWISSIAYYPTRLTDAQLQALTA